MSTLHRRTQACVATLFVMTAIAACSKSQNLSAGSTWVVDKTVTIDKLVIPADAHIAAPPGKNVTMTVNGVGTAIAPGTYTGNVVLTPTDDIPVKYLDLEHHFRTALYIDNGKVVQSKSVPSIITGGKVDDNEASNISITSNEEKFNGIYVTGNSKYTINNATFKFTGNGGNDFAGFGAAIMATDHADLTVNNATIINKGAVRTAVFVGGNAVVHVNDSNIEVYNGTLPPDYKFNVDLGKMMEVPWMLGLSGNVRATNLVDYGTVYYNHSHIKSQGWGALSTDATKHVRMYVTDSVIETTDSGYGAYSIGDAVDTFSASTFNVADVGLIIGAEGSAVFTDGTKVNSGRFGVMMHSGVGGGTLTIDKGSVFDTKSTAIEVKGRGTTIAVDNAKLNPGNGILLEAMINDDPYMSGMGAGGPPAGGAPGAAPGGPAPSGDTPSGPGSAGMVGTVGAAASKFSPDVVATFKNVDLQGDLINARTSQGDMIITLENAKLAGAITTATAAPATGQAPTAETRRLIGEVKNTFGPSADKKNGAQVTVDKGSTWTVNQTSYLTKLTLAAGATLNAPAGKKATLKVNGAVKPIRAGTYAGKIVVEVK